jgi:hypothetical protein
MGPCPFTSGTPNPWGIRAWKCLSTASVLDTEIAIARAIEHVAAALVEPETPEENGAGIARAYTLLRP